MTTANGISKQEFLGKPKTAGYTPSVAGLATAAWWDWDHRPWFSLRDVMRMRRDPRVQFGLRILRAPLHTVTWEVTGPAAVAQWVDRTLRRFWENDLSKALAMLEWGRAGGEPLWKLGQSTGLVEFEKLKDVHPLDLKPLELGGELVGVHVYHVPGSTGPVKLFPPQACYFVNEPEYGSLYGLSRLRGAWDSWMEKRGRHGAIDIRRLWYVKNAYRGGTLYHPAGVTETEPGQFKSNQDIAREIVEKTETGGVLTMPNSMDPETRERLWQYEPPQINGELRDVRDYPKDLDAEILEGLGIPVEVVKAAETGSGWSGRSVPFLVWLTGEDEIVDNLVQTFERQVIRPGAIANFGAGVKYAIRVRSLVPEPQEGQPGLGGQEGQQPAPDGQQRPGLQPYTGPKGGQGFRNPNTGAVSYRRQRFSQEDDGGRWITIGGSKGEDGKRHGGSPVYIKNGRIVKGHPSLTGKKIAALKEEGPETAPTREEWAKRQHNLARQAGESKMDWPTNPELEADFVKLWGAGHEAYLKHLQAKDQPEKEPSHRQQLKQSREYARAVWAKKARKEGVKAEHLHQLAAELIEHDREYGSSLTHMLQDARKQAVGSGHGDLRTLAARVSKGKTDASHVSGLDDVAASMAERYPELFVGQDSSTERLFELLLHGNPEGMSEDDAYEQALEMLREKQPEPDEEDDPVPFSLGEQPRDNGGRFVADAMLHAADDGEKENNVPAPQPSPLVALARLVREFLRELGVRLPALDEKFVGEIVQEALAEGQGESAGAEPLQLSIPDSIRQKVREQVRQRFSRMERAKHQLSALEDIREQARSPVVIDMAPVAAAIEQIGEKLAQQPTPVINLPAPVVNVEVAAPAVTVEPAAVKIEAPVYVEAPKRPPVNFRIETDGDGNRRIVQE